MPTGTASSPEPFALLIESTGSATSLPPPPHWTHTPHVVPPLTVDAHVRPATASSTSLTPPLLTFHDVGQNAGISFGPFLSFCRTHPPPCHQIDAAVAHYHLTAPGHAPDAPGLGAEARVDVDVLVEAVCEVLRRFELKRVVGFGVGLGAGVLLRAAVRRPAVFAGLVLVSPIVLSAGVFEKVALGAEGLFGKSLGLGLSRRVKDRLLARWLSDEARESNFALVQSVEEGLDRLHAGNVVRVLEGEVARGEVVEEVAGVGGKVLLVTGKESALRFHTEESFPRFDPARTSWLDVQDSGSLVHEEHPDRVAKALSLFLQSLPAVQ